MSGQQPMTSRVPISIAFTPEYVIPAITGIFSVLMHADDADKFHFICLLTKDLPKHIKQYLERFDGDRTQFSFVVMTGRLNDIYIDEKYTVAASYRLLLADLLPDYDKVVYMDCDIIFQNNLAELYREIDLKGYYMCGVFEATLPNQYVHMDAIGCQVGHYVNSGFLIMNLKDLRMDGMVAKFIDASRGEHLVFPDQDVINVLCKGKILQLPPLWNSIRTFLLPQYKPVFLKYYTERDWKDVQVKGNIHYTGPKPWNSFTVAFDTWWKYYDMIPRDLRAQYPVNWKMYLLYKVYNNKFGKFTIDAVRSAYRKFGVNGDKKYGE